MKGRWKITLVLIVLVVASGVTGALIARNIERRKAYRRMHPEAWNVSAMSKLERRLKLTPEQKDKAQVILDRGVVELTAVREDTVAKTNAILDRMITEMSGELTPEQRVELEKIKSEHNTPALQMLNVKPPAAPATPAPR